MIELLSACVILAVAATLSIGAASGMRGSQERLAVVNAVESALRRARAVAASDLWGGRAVELAFGEHIEIRPEADAFADQGEAATRSLESIRVEMPTRWNTALVRRGGLVVDGAGSDDATLPFASGGASVDAVVLCRSERGDVAVVEVLGISGQTETHFGDAAVERLREVGISLW